MLNNAFVGFMHMHSCTHRFCNTFRYLSFIVITSFSSKICETLLITYNLKDSMITSYFLLVCLAPSFIAFFLFFVYIYQFFTHAALKLISLELNVEVAEVLPFLLALDFDNTALWKWKSHSAHSCITEDAFFLSFIFVTYLLFYIQTWRVAQFF